MILIRLEFNSILLEATIKEFLRFYNLEKQIRVIKALYKSHSSTEREEK